ncbi:MAG: TonB-dependent receptor [Alphaproteobacteria bacterium]|nr:TonB-dependent receptor [Alphaproteobacteria bacterium]
MKFGLLITSAIAYAGAASAVAQTSGPAADPSVDVIVVLGEGESRQVQTLTSDDLALEAAGTSAIKLIESLPGVNYTAADPFGAYEWAVNINIRGFQKDQLGYTLDGVPLGDMSYGNFNGLHISRAIISENIDRVELAQGAASVSTASTSNLGGSLEFFSRAPEDDFGGMVQVTGGSENTLRGYARIESGVIAGLGGKASLSYVNSSLDKWKGDGEQNHQQANFRFEQPLPVGVLSGFYNWSERRENDYQDLSLEMLSRLGYGWDNFAPDWTLANRVADIANNRGDTGATITNPGAGTVYPAPIVSVDDAYYDASGLRDDTLARVSYDADFNDTVSLSATVYNHTDEGQGIWYTPYANPYTTAQTGPGVFSPVSVRTTEYDMDRIGGLGSLTFNLGAHTLSGGAWFETNEFNQARRFYANQRAAPRDSLKFMTNPFATQWEFDYEFETQMFYISDVWEVTDRLTLNAGAKSVTVDMSINTIANGFAGFTPGSDADVDGTITSEDNFLPQVGVSYEINDNSEIFAGYTENMRAFTLAPNNNRSQISFDAIKARTDPESTQTTEVGFRYRNGAFQGVAAAYYVTFEDRLLGISQGAGIIGNPSIISNVGGVTTKGFELAGGYDFTDEISLFASYSYNDSAYDDDVRNALGVVVQATGGKTLVNTPENLFKADLSYDNGSLFGQLSASFTDERFFSYLNNAKVDSYTTADLTAGYRFSGSPLLEGLELQINVTNLTDEEFVSTVGTNGFNTAPDNQTLMVGSPRQFFATVKKAF